MSALRLTPSPSPTRPTFEFDDESDIDMAEQRSISLSSPPESRRESRNPPIHVGSSSLNTDFQVTHDETPKAPEAGILGPASPSVTYEEDKDRGASAFSVSGPPMDTTETFASPSTQNSSNNLDETLRSPQTFETNTSFKYPPPPLPEQTYPERENDTASMISYSSSSSRKARPESKLMEPPIGPIVPGIALVDFNHLVGPKIEFSDGNVFNDEQLSSILPFLALPDGAHISSEDYSYFHLVPASPYPTTIYGISCNRQIAASDLLVKDEDVTRSTVQKAVVVLASKPVFGPIRDRLGVVTRALFSQRDFRETGILVDFKNSLESSLRSQLTESALYMGTNLRELVHKFRSRTLLLLKSLILQKRIMFYGHPVERLCTYQYSLISLIPGLLQNLDDCGSPPLASRAKTLSRASSLRTSDRKSLMAYLGLPLDIFGKDSFFQPYLPLQQVDLTKETRGYLCGSTNTIVTQQKDIDLLVNIETNTFEFRDPHLERLVALTPADRKWMDDIVKDVNDGWNDADPSRSMNMQFRGSDDYIRTKFEEYITAALASVRYADFLVKTQRSDTHVSVVDGGDANAIQDFNPSWISEFRRTNAYEVWDQITDPMIFDIVEARHPCSGKPGVVEDIGLRLSEGLQELHIQEQLAPTREAISRTLASGSSSFFKAVEGVRGRWAQRSNSSLTMSESGSSTSIAPVEISRSEAELAKSNANDTDSMRSSRRSTSSLTALRPPSLSSVTSLNASTVAAEAKTALGGWGTSIGSFISQRTARLSAARTTSTSSDATTLVASPTSELDQNVTLQTTKSVDGMATESTTPTPSMFSSWSFGKASATPTKPSTPTPDLANTSISPLESEEDNLVKGTQDPGDHGSLSQSSGSKRNSTSSSMIQPGVAL